MTEGIYQVRGFEMSNMTLVESDHGVIVIDPLISEEVAVGDRPVPGYRGDRAVTAVIYTHAHLDHFGGVLGVVDAAPRSRSSRRSTSWNTRSRRRLCGEAMLRRSYYYAATGLPKARPAPWGLGWARVGRPARPV